MDIFTIVCKSEDGNVIIGAYFGARSSASFVLTPSQAGELIDQIKKVSAEIKADAEFDAKVKSALAADEAA